jgi:hypothetical protein
MAETTVIGRRTANLLLALAYSESPWKLKKLNLRNVLFRITAVAAIESADLETLYRLAIA